MFNCQVCASPFGRLFGGDDAESATGRQRSRRRADSDSRRRDVRNLLTRQTSDEDDDSSHNGIRRARSDERVRFRPRSPDEALVKVKAWSNYLHQRAHDFWDDETGLHHVLKTLASNVDKEADPVIGDEKNCVFWFGDQSTDGYPIMSTQKPGEAEPSDTYVTRTLVFLYADDESFEELQRKPKGPFRMVCNEKNCINLNHISLD